MFWTVVCGSCSRGSVFSSPGRVRSEEGVYFKVTRDGHLLYLGTFCCPRPDHFSFVEGPDGDHIMPCHVYFHPPSDTEGDSSCSDDEDHEPAVRIGGQPVWQADDETPDCLAYQQRMLFVGQLRATDFSDELQDCYLFLFFCPDCEVQCIIDQPCC
ncbi:hypothetical protein WJX72_009669 [[Myrmecia] bisecta]|uniref:Uncharacterized protein n=1 Tax=[Myrmecia] bisecta TaxID=41462 RepID=A0AAW1QGD7_9CHLO